MGRPTRQLEVQQDMFDFVLHILLQCCPVQSCIDTTFHLILTAQSGDRSLFWPSQKKSNPIIAISEIFEARACSNLLERLRSTRVNGRKGSCDSWAVGGNWSVLLSRCRNFSVASTAELVHRSHILVDHRCSRAGFFPRRMDIGLAGNRSLI